jgi:hypothetical protein
VTQQRELFTKALLEKIGGPIDPGDLAQLDPSVATLDYEMYEDDVTPEMQDRYVGAEVNLTFQGTIRAGKVKRRARNEEGELEGIANANPILDTRAYQVEFDDGELAAYSANVIAENMYAQCDEFGNQYRLMEELIDHRTDGRAVKIADQFITIRGREHKRKMTIGWTICVQWKNGETSWERLSDLKESNPLEVAEYAVSQSIDHEPAFSWWVPHVLKKARKDYISG